MFWDKAEDAQETASSGTWENSHSTYFMRNLHSTYYIPILIFGIPNTHSLIIHPTHLRFHSTFYIPILPYYILHVHTPNLRTTCQYSFSIYYIPIPHTRYYLLVFPLFFSSFQILHSQSSWDWKGLTKSFLDKRIDS